MRNPEQKQEAEVSVQQKNSEQNKIVGNIIIGAFERARYDTFQHQRLAKALGVSEDGSCLLDITSILESFQRKSATEQMIKDLIDAFTKVGLEDIASQICFIQKCVRGGQPGKIESRNRSYNSELHDSSQDMDTTSRLNRYNGCQHFRNHSFKWHILSMLCLLLSVVLLIHCNLPTKKQIIGAVGFRRKELNWIRYCPTSVNYTKSLNPMNKQISLYGATQVGDEIWQCGGTTPGVHKTGIRGIQDTRQIVNGKTNDIEKNDKKGGSKPLT